MTVKALDFLFGRQLAARLQRPDGRDAVTRQRIGAQQIDLLFRNVAPGVVGAGLTNLFLGGFLVRLGAVSAVKGSIWALYIFSCVVAHLLLLHRYKRTPFDEKMWRFWAANFTLVSFVEGLGWGWAPVWLVDPGHDDLRLLVVCVTMIVGTAAVPAFGSYLPAFFALFIPASSMFAISLFHDREGVFAVVAYMYPLYLFTIPVLAVQAARKFSELVALRLKSAQLAEHLRSQIDLVEQAMIAKSNFLAAASHDLRQPVHAIGLFAGALTELALPEPAQRLTDQIQNSVVALDALFAALLDISRLDAQAVEVRKGDFAVEPLIGRICRDFAAEASAKSIELRWAPCSARLHTDPILLERILRNLISNAVRYTPHGRVLVGCRRRGSSVEIQVWDTGIGIAPEHRDFIFKEYFQLHNSERDRQKGLGLGLSIVQRLTTLLDCPLTLRSRINRGSCFSVRIPLAARDAPLPTESARSLGGRGSGLIAVVDDEAPILWGMETLLQSWGYAVVAASGGEDVLAKLSLQPSRPDLIISDYWLREGETAFDAIDAIRAEYNTEIPAIVISGDTGAELRARAQAAGVALMHKPVPNGSLRAAISSLTAAGRGISAELESSLALD